MLLRKPRSYSEVYNDLDEEVVNFFRVLQEPSVSERLNELLRMTPFSRKEYELAYKPSDDRVERARRLVIRSWMGYGSNAHNRTRKSGFRANATRSGTVPAHDWVNYSECFPLLVERLRGVIIECKDAADILRTHDSSQTLHYVDPPYIHSTRARGMRQRDYNFELDDDQHAELAKVLISLRGMESKQPFVLREFYD